MSLVADGGASGCFGFMSIRAGSRVLDGWDWLGYVLTEWDGCMAGELEGY